MDGGLGSGAGRDNGVEEDGDVGGGGVGGVGVGGGGSAGGGTVVGEVVVVFDGLEGGAFAEKAEVVDWDGGGEDIGDCYSISPLSLSLSLFARGVCVEYRQSSPIQTVESGQWPDWRVPADGFHTPIRAVFCPINRSISFTH